MNTRKLKALYRNIFVNLFNPALYHDPYTHADSKRIVHKLITKHGIVNASTYNKRNL